MSQNASVAELDSTAVVTETRLKLPKRTGPRATGLDPQLEWLLTCGDAALGAKGTLAGVIASLERGGPTNGARLDEAGCYDHPYKDEQLGIGRTGDVELHRWLSGAFLACSLTSQIHLCWRYRAPRAAFRSDEGFGALDRHVEGSDGKAGHHAPLRTGIEAQLGELAELALRLSPDPAKVLVACQDPNRKGNRKVIREAVAIAVTADKSAHDEWYESKAAADPMRKTSQRRKVLPAHVPGVAKWQE